RPAELRRYRLFGRPAGRMTEAGSAATGLAISARTTVPVPDAVGPGGAEDCFGGRRVVYSRGEMSFTYLLAKLGTAAICCGPFPHVYLENFLDQDDFEAVVSSPDITLPTAASIHELFSLLDAASYQPVEFPGCTKSRAEYVAWLETAVKPKDTHAACEGKGM